MKGRLSGDKSLYEMLCEIAPFQTVQPSRNQALEMGTVSLALLELGEDVEGLCYQTPVQSAAMRSKICH